MPKCINIMNSSSEPSFRWRCHDLIHSNWILQYTKFINKLCGFLLRLLWTMVLEWKIKWKEKKKTIRQSDLSHCDNIFVLDFAPSNRREWNARQNHVVVRCSAIPLKLNQILILSVFNHFSFGVYLFPLSANLSAFKAWHEMHVVFKTKSIFYPNVM